MIKSEIILSKPSEWQDWYEDFVARAETSEIFEYVDIDRLGPTLRKPVMPTRENAIAKINEQAYSTWIRATQHNAATAGQRPQPVDKLTEVQQAELMADQQEYKIRMISYSSEQRAYAELAAWVRSTVDKRYLNNTSTKKDLRTIVQELKSSIAPSKTEEVQEARWDYRQVLIQTKRIKPEDWLISWNKARLQGEKLDIPELKGSIAIDDFLTAISSFNSAWALNYQGLVESNRKKTGDDGYTLRELAELFQTQVRRNRNAKMAESVFTISGITEMESHCPCGIPSNRHNWKPKDCATVQLAVNGKAKNGRRVKETYVKACKEALQNPKWKTLVEAVKGRDSSATSQGSDQQNKEDNSRRHGSFIGLTFETQGLTNESTDTVFTALQQQHPLYNSTIYDGGATTHVVNNKDLLTDTSEASDTDYVMIGDGSLKVQARGTRILRNLLDGADGKNTRDLILRDVAYVPRFHTNIISAKKLRKKGLWHCGFDHTLRMGSYEDNDILCRMTEKYDLDIVEYKPIARSYFKLPQMLITVFNAFQDVFSTFQATSLQPARLRIATSRQPPPARLDTPNLWHLRACHAGPDALEQLVLRTKGVRVKGPTTVQCTSCGTSKATEIISRRESPHKSRQPFYRIFADIFQFSAAYNGHKYVLLITDEYSGMMFCWSTTSKTEVARITMNFEARIKRHTGASICKIRIDNETSLFNRPDQRKSVFQDWLDEQGIEVELPPSNTKEPTGGAERPGGINQQRMRNVFGLLPQEIWPEVYQGVVWVHNILPSRRNGWMSPKEKIDSWFHQHFRWYRPPNADFDTTRDHRPGWHGVYAYGCKAYPLDPKFKAKQDKNFFKLAPRAHVGYLVGYHASNIYRIWVPKLNRVILSRDVRFNEEEFFNPAKEEQLETEPIAEYIPTPQTLEPLPQRGWDSILDEFLYEFDKHVLDRSPEGSNSGVEGAKKHAQSAPRLQTPQDEPLQQPTPDQTPRPAARDASPARRNTGTLESTEFESNVQSPGPSRPVTSSAARCTEAEPEGDFDEDLSSPLPDDQVTPNRVRLGTPIPSQSSTPSDSSTQPDIQTSASQLDEQPAATTTQDEMATRRRRTAQEIYGDQPTRRSQRTPKPKRKFSEFASVNSTFTASLPTNQLPQGNLTTFHSVFLTAVSKVARDHRFHRDDLVRLPKRYQDLENHPMASEFKTAVRKELHDLLKRGTWRLIDREKARAPLLPLKWVFNYKFDQDGYLQRCKARICVRGDLQDDDGLETYAATLAAKTFRVVMATAAHFDLDVRQFDVSNAFLYSELKKDQPTYVQLPKGYVELGFLNPGESSTMVAQLDKALYGLRESPLLWYNEISQALKEAGINRTDEEPCVFTNGKILVLVYVDDILILSPRQEKLAVDDLIKQLQSKYEMREDEFKWYLGIRVIRDRPSRKIYLCQDAYIEKIARKFKLTDSSLQVPAIPIPAILLVKNSGQASKEEIKDYQERVGSIMYVAVMTRPDVARAAAHLARFLTNPSAAHLAAANQCIRYLYATRFLAIVYDGAHQGEVLVIASDASFADDIETRRSSQGYVMMLFNGPVAWKVGLQDTVTTSTTEAELLSLEKTAKESYGLSRLLRDISLDLGPLKLYCDNLQTIRLVVEENQRITTKLRHIDIQNMWLKQEFRKGRFLVEYLKTDQMPADGLTKALSRSKFEYFRSMLNLIDIKREIHLEDRSV